MPKTTNNANAGAQCTSRWSQSLSVRAGVPSTLATQVPCPSPPTTQGRMAAYKFFTYRALRTGVSAPPHLGPQMSQRTGTQGCARWRSRSKILLLRV